MKKLLILLFASMALTVSAQQAKSGNGPRGERPRGEMRQANKQKGFNLSEEDKNTFDALNEEYKKDRKAIREKYRGEKVEKGQKLTDEQLDARMKNRFACRKAMLELEEKYYPKYRKVLTPAQTAMVLNMYNAAPRQKFAQGKNAKMGKGKGAPRGKRGQGQRGQGQGMQQK